MNTGTLVKRRGSDCMDIRFGLYDYHGGLQCGETLDVKISGKWVPTRIEMGDDWYLVGINVDTVEIAHNNAAALSVLDIQILDGEDGLQYVFDYSASRYEQETMSEFQSLFMRVVAAIVNNANTDGYDFEQLKKDVLGKKDLWQRIKGIFFD